MFTWSEVEHNDDDDGDEGGGDDNDDNEGGDNVSPGLRWSTMIMVRIVVLDTLVF